MDFSEALSLIDELHALSEGREKKHNPFRHYSSLGSKSPKARHGADEKGDWECTKKGPYTQVCKGVGPDNEGQTKVVHIDQGYKKAYNHDYKTGQASGKYVPATRSGGSRKSKKKKSA